MSSSSTRRVFYASVVVFLTAQFLWQSVRVPAEAKKQKSQSTIFSSPDAEPDVVPTFVGNGGKPITANRDLKTPGFNDARQLPSLTKDQRKKIDDLQKDLNLRLSSIREHMLDVQTALDAMKAHPNETVTIGTPGRPGEVVPRAEKLKAEIDGLRKEIKAKQDEATAEIPNILTPQQMDEYQQMRHGQLVISGEARPSADPTGPYRKNKTTGKPKPNSRFVTAIRRLFHKDGND